jgi:diguanylate cyclase (GGDEF)-like protein
MRVLATALPALLVGRDPRQHLRTSQAMLVLAVYAVFAVVQHLEVLMGLIDERASWLLTAWNVGGGIGFYVLLRSGLNRRLPKDRSLTIPQTLWAIVGIAWSYGITGPARGAVILIMMLVIMFGMFSLTPARARTMAATAFALLAGVMIYKAATDPAHYDPRVEGLHLVFSGIVIAACSVLSVRIGRLRARLELQRSELSSALERIQALATRDELTGLLNRRAVLERLHLELCERNRELPRLCVALIDLDHFKRVNDQHGHAAGDQVLRRFAELAREEIRNGDVLARWGGEEFLLMMPGADAAQGLRGLARIRERLHASPLNELAQGLVVTFSAGVAECLSEPDLEPAIERADQAMYRAKALGRDRALCAG